LPRSIALHATLLLVSTTQISWRATHSSLASSQLDQHPNFKNAERKPKRLGRKRYGVTIKFW